MEEKLKKLISRLADIEALLGSNDILSDQKRYRELTREHRYLLDIQEAYHTFLEEKRGIEENEQLLKEESDSALLEMIREDLEKLRQNFEISRRALEALLVPPDPRDNHNVIMELRAGTGGDEAALFVGDCVRMYRLFADKMKWKTEVISFMPSDAGGYKEYIQVISGKNVFRFLQYEGGTHRVQRVPATETQGRVHTSAITVAIMTEPDEKEEDIVIDEKDLKIDTYRASGAGGQHVNTTDSAVRITHMPTGTVVCCQQERSQHKNKDQAMRLLKAKIQEVLIEKEKQERSEVRSSQVGSGDRSEKIRTYNYPQNRVTDHRLNLTLYKLDRIMEGDMQEVLERLVFHFNQQKLASEG
ncbi:MAG: peptide chain release factor 1 [Simkaniaceae bacterium]